MVLGSVISCNLFTEPNRDSNQSFKGDSDIVAKCCECIMSAHSFGVNGIH